MPDPLKVEFSGCAVVLEGPRCVVPDNRQLRLWLPADDGRKVLLQADGKLLTASASRDVQTGVLYEIAVPSGARSLHVQAGVQQWRLPLLEEEAQPAVFAEALSLYRSGDAARGRELIEAQLQQLPAAWQGKALNLIGQMYRREGNRQAAQRNLEASVTASAGAQRRSEAIKTATVLAFMLVSNGREFGRAREVMQALAPAPPGDAESRYDISYTLGLVAFNAGNARVALRELGQAVSQAERMDKPSLKSYGESLLAVQLQQLGRRALASDLLAAWADALPADISPCNRALHLTNLGWSRLLIMEAGEAAADPVPALTEALSIAETQCSANDRMNALTNLALAHLHAGDAQQASSYVARARLQTEAPRLRTVLWLLDIEARIALALGDTSRSLALFQELEALAEATLSSDAQWRAAVGKASVQRSMGDTQAALRSFAAADNLLNDAIFKVPLDAGRETLATSRAWATRLHLDLLLAEGSKTEAFALARHARSRVLASLSVAERIAALQPAERARWENALAQYQGLRESLDESAGNAWMLPADALARLQHANREKKAQLRRIVDDAVASLNVAGEVQQKAPRNGELLLAFHPLPDGWAVFSHDGMALDAHRSNCADDDDTELAACLLRPLAEQLRHASVVRVLPVGRLKSVDFHAVKVSGAALIDSAAVVYAADIEVQDKAVPRSGHALLVADGLGDLAAAREELQIVDKALLRGGGWRSSIMSGDQARAAAVLREIETADLFHFAGHARFQGELGWDSALKLADSSWVDVTDILTLKTAPSLVVLSGCETARTSGALQPESVGLANAFLVAGSASVIATARPVRDDAARSMVASFYEAWMAGQPPHQALRTAQLRLRDTQPESDWAAYRLIER